MAVRWTITFKTLNDHTGLVKVYDSTYSGDPIALEPADNAFSTSRRLTEFIQPVVTDSGYLRVIDNDIASEHIEDLHPIGALDRPVEFYLDNVIKWRGYISPESFTMNWEPAPRIVELPLRGALSVLDSVNMVDNGTGLQSIAAFLVEILNATGFSWSKVVMDTQMYYAFNLGGYFYTPMLRILLSRYNFLDRNDDDDIYQDDWTPYTGKNYLEVLTEICRYFCCYAVQDGDALYLCSPRTVLPYKPYDVTWAALSALASHPLAAPAGITQHTVPRPSKSMSLIGWDGVNHKKSINNGYKSVEVKGALNKRNDAYPLLNFLGKELNSFTESHEAWQVEDLTVNGTVIFLDSSKEAVVFHSWRYDGEYGSLDGQWSEVEWAIPTQDSELCLQSAALVKGCSWDGGANPNPTYRNLLRIACDVTIGGGSYHYNHIHPLATIKARAASAFMGGGCINIGAVVWNSWYSFYNLSGRLPDKDQYGVTQWQPVNHPFQVQVKIGNKYWDGSAWTTTESWFKMQVGNGGSFPDSAIEYGVVRPTKKANESYQNATGYVIPITSAMYGVLEITFANYDNNHYTAGNLYGGAAAIYVEKLSVDYNAPEDSEAKTAVQNMKLKTGTPFSDSLTVDLDMTSVRSVCAGHGILWWGDVASGISPVGNNGPILVYSEQGTGYTTLFPEKWLTDTLKIMYSKPSEWLELETEYDDALLMWSLITNAGKNYLITGYDTNYADEHTKLIIASYE